METRPEEREALPEWGMTRRRDRRGPRITPVAIYLVYENCIVCIKVWV